MNHVKQFRTIDQQLKLLQDRNFTIEPEQYQDAVSFFLRNNYYRISGYTLTLRQDDMFSDQANLDTLIQIYEADRRMRHIMLSIIEVIEVKAKSVIAYLHSEKYGPLGYKDINNFNCMNDNGINLDMVSEYQRITSKVNRQKSSMLKTEQFIKHHKENRNDILPFWVYVELLTVSDTTILYKMLDRDLQRKIAEEFNFLSNKNFEIVQNLLRCVTQLRNYCAHNSRLYGRLFSTKPHLSKQERQKLLIGPNKEVIDNRLFSYVLVLKSLTSQHDFKIIKDHISEIFDDYTLIDKKYYGFPSNWKECL